MPSEEHHEKVTTKCPTCGSSRVRRSHRSGNLEKFLALLGGKVRRCEACRARFVRFWFWTLNSEHAQRQMRQAWYLCLMLAGSASLVLFLLWLVNRESGGPPPGE